MPKISEYAAITALDDDDILVIVEDGANKKVTIAQLRAALVGFTHSYARGSWTPTIVDDGGVLNYGSGAIRTGRYLKQGRLVNLWGTVKFGTTSFNQGTGNYRIGALPYEYSADVPDGTGLDIGVFHFGEMTVWDDSAAVHRIGTLSRWTTGSKQLLGIIEEDGTTNNFFGAGQPWAWGPDDQINFHVCYETDE